MHSLRTSLCGAAMLAVFCASEAQQLGKDRPQEGTLKVGDRAPDFKLKTLDGKSEVQLASFKDKKPVVLVFGSYT